MFTFVNTSLFVITTWQMDLPEINTQTLAISITCTELLSFRTRTFFLWLSTVDRLKDLDIGYYLPRRQRTCRGVWRYSNGSCLLAGGSPTDTIGCQNFRTFPTRQIAFFCGRAADAGNAVPTFCVCVPAISKLTTLTVESLWTAPTETAKQLILAIDETS